MGLCKWGPGGLPLFDWACPFLIGPAPRAPFEEPHLRLYKARSSTPSGRTRPKAAAAWTTSRRWSTRRGRPCPSRSWTTATHLGVTAPAAAGALQGSDAVVGRGRKGRVAG